MDEVPQTCQTCIWGAGWTCANVAPLPFGMAHHCAHHRAADTSHLRPAGAEEPGGLHANHERAAQWHTFLAEVHAADAEHGPRMRNTGPPQ